MITPLTSRRPTVHPPSRRRRARRIGQRLCAVGRKRAGRHSPGRSVPRRLTSAASMVTICRYAARPATDVSRSRESHDEAVFSVVDRCDGRGLPSRAPRLGSRASRLLDGRASSRGQQQGRLAVRHASRDPTGVATCPSSLGANTGDVGVSARDRRPRAGPRVVRVNRGPRGG